jgi:hypothetical protein
MHKIVFVSCLALISAALTTAVFARQAHTRQAHTRHVHHRTYLAQARAPAAESLTTVGTPTKHLGVLRAWVVERPAVRDYHAGSGS